MQWTDSAILLSIRKYGENSALVRAFSREHGVYGGVVRSATSKTMRGVVQSGNIVSATWQARLQEQLGSFKLEMTEPVAALLMQYPDRLAALTSVCALVESALPERHPYPRLYTLLTQFLQLLKTGEDWQQHYIYLELELLAETGFGLDLRECAATGEKENLVYVSPKSGRAVSEDAGMPYREKLLPLPSFLLPANKKNLAKGAEILDGLHLTGYFLEHWLLAPHHRKLPAARSRLIYIVKENNAAKTDS
jgi:DNA repair protein RecO (recombination protein O)